MCRDAIVGVNEKRGQRESNLLFPLFLHFLVDLGEDLGAWSKWAANPAIALYTQVQVLGRLEWVRSAQ